MWCAELPTNGQICRFTDWKVTLEKVHWAHKYFGVIRVEKTGREIHQRRFFLKASAKNIGGYGFTDFCHTAHFQWIVVTSAAYSCLRARW